jgi:hypothetical protein
MCLDDANLAIACRMWPPTSLLGTLSPQPDVGVGPHGQPHRVTMANRKATTSSSKATDTSVDAYLAALEHPHKKGVQALRRAILDVDARIREEVKWNAPSFCLDDHFATFRLHPGSVFQLILHTGAKAKGNPRQFRLDDPQGFVKWAAKDRCIMAFESDADAMTKRSEVVRMVRDWIAQL